MILLGNAYNEPQIGSHHAIPGALAHADLVALSGGEILLRQFLELLHLLNMVRQLNLFSGGQQWNPTDAAEIKPDGIGGQAAALS